MAGASLEELMSVLKGAGLPLGGDASSMQDAVPGAQQQIQNTVSSQDTVGPGLKSSFHDQLSKIAAMDQQLHGLYNDPSSPLHINDPGKALKLQAGASDTGYKAANFITSAEKANTSQLEKKSSDALGLYSKMIAAQNKEESVAKNRVKDDIAVASGKKQYVTDSTGQKVAVSTPKGKGSGTAKLTKEQQYAGFEDSTAANYWQQVKETDFKREWAQHMLDGSWQAPKGGFSINDVKKEYDYWKSIQPAKKNALSRSGGGTGLSASELTK
jgi:hypothetical protein